MLTLEQFRALLAAGGIKGVTAVGMPGGFCLRITPKDGDAGPLMSRRQQRRFAKLDTLATFLHAEGIRRFAVEADKWEPGQTWLKV